MNIVSDLFFSYSWKPISYLHYPIVTTIFCHESSIEDPQENRPDLHLPSPGNYNSARLSPPQESSWIDVFLATAC